ncbi:hypothetical protein Avbf_10910 [Armadillidium vulgare]|nr:hypothetical protein Avbf_10910 [Armadillidium vulgare]
MKKIKTQDRSDLNPSLPSLHEYTVVQRHRETRLEVKDEAEKREVHKHKFHCTKSSHLKYQILLIQKLTLSFAALRFSTFSSLELLPKVSSSLSWKESTLKVSSLVSWQESTGKVSCLASWKESASSSNEMSSSLVQ